MWICCGRAKECKFRQGVSLGSEMKALEVWRLAYGRSRRPQAAAAVLEVYRHAGLDEPVLGAPTGGDAPTATGAAVLARTRCPDRAAAG